MFLDNSSVFSIIIIKKTNFWTKDSLDGKGVQSKVRFLNVRRQNVLLKM